MLILLKQLKVLDIASRNFNLVISILKSSLIYIKEILLLSLLFGILIILLFDISHSQLFITIITILIFDLIILFSIGNKRRKEIEEINSVIKAIRKNKILNESEIKLSGTLKDLEDNIKAMLLRTQKDIASMSKLANARSEFLGYVSHELRTPIFTIQGYLETLLNGAINDPKVNKKFIEKALYHSDNLNVLLNDLIDISMIESGLMQLSYRYFNLFNFFDEIVKQIKPTITNENVELVLFDFNKNVEVYGDKDKLKQVMNNLLSNALKYTQKGKVEIIVIANKKSVLIKIKDTGIGIAEKDIDRIFERFYRTERDRESSIPGTGLGLSIVKHILEAHNSAIEVQSELNVGSEFSFKLKRE
ncbi:MAG: two-component sensor histidine kinase [Ignavibacteriales bacterium]|nr:two-component sensor histidine kinase [Ignavibacteriales bacterium]